MEVMLRDKVEVADELYTGKVVVAGAVAVLYSPGFGAGWYTWNREHPELVFDPAIVHMVTAGKFDELETFMTLKYPDVYLGGMKDLEVMWVKQGRIFRIAEYDGNESIEYKDEDESWMLA
jgi:hypothetical protein